MNWIVSLLSTPLMQRIVLVTAENLAKRSDNDLDDVIVKEIKTVLYPEEKK